mmetsp:Transcript_1890/g.3719  ORF Transcript_1890/g.3719 Transcript_1890/m.3719 type:complete len:162 (-) Transcript_1890:287-772(-)
MRGELRSTSSRISKLEKRVSVCEARDELQTKGIHRTRMVLADVASVTCGEKDELSGSSIRAINSWWEFEKLSTTESRGEVKHSKKGGDTKVKTTTNTPAKKRPLPKRGRKHSSLERVQPDKKVTPTLKLNKSTLRTIIESVESEDEDEGEISVDSDSNMEQ